VIEWIIRRLEGAAGAIESPIGRLPITDELTMDGLDISADDLAALFEVNRESWLAESELTAEFFARFDGRVPAALNAELASLRYHLTR
jgi:phosphoenolpyruvate carboxykinase (GTP)